MILKKNFIIFFFFSYFFCLSFIDMAIAEEEYLKKTDDFFSKGFVVKNKTKISEKKSNNGFIEMGEEPPTPTPTLFIEKESFLQGKKVLYINALINADDLEHFKKYKETVEDFCLKEEIHLKNLYAICHNCDTIKVNETFNPFHYWILGGDFSILKKIPSIYATIQKSPSYVVGLEKGEIILEGADLLTKYINEKGYYLGDIEIKKENIKFPSSFKLPLSIQKMITKTVTPSPTLTPTSEDSTKEENWF